MGSLRLTHPTIGKPGMQEKVLVTPDFLASLLSLFLSLLFIVIFAVPGHVLGELEVLAGESSGDRRGGATKRLGS